MTLKRTELKRGTKPLARKTPISSVPKAAPKKKPKPKKPTAKQYKLWCDTLFSLIVRHRGSCLRCCRSTDLQCSHIVSRGYLATRWDEDNAIVACKGCHHWQHMNPLENEAWLQTFGVDLLALKHK